MERFSASNINQRLSSSQHHHRWWGRRRGVCGGQGLRQFKQSLFVPGQSVTLMLYLIFIIGTQLSIVYITWRSSCRVNFTKKINEIPHIILGNCVAVQCLYINCLIPLFKIFCKSLKVVATQCSVVVVPYTAACSGMTQL